MSKHTKEPWYASNESGNWRVMAADENGGYTLADMCCDTQQANALRIVVCLNACAGIDNATLEAGAIVESSKLYAADQARAKLERERDELLTLAEDAHEAWNNDKDVRVGKLLLAMMDEVFRKTYRPDLTKVGAGGTAA